MGSPAGLKMLKRFTPEEIRRQSQLDHERRAAGEMERHLGRERLDGTGAALPPRRITLGIRNRLGVIP